jgi:hypothetical protein
MRVRITGAEPVLGGGKDAAQQHVADLGRGEVEHALHLAAVDQLFHRLPADAGGVEHQAIVVVVQRAVTCCTQGVVTPNMVRPMAGLRGCAAGRARAP